MQIRAFSTRPSTASRQRVVAVKASARAATSDMKKAAVGAIAAMLVMTMAPNANATYFTDKIAQDEALIESAQAKLDAALQLQLNKSKAETVGKKQEIARRAGALTNQIETKLNEDMSKLKVIESKAAESKEAAKQKAELQKEVAQLINVEAKLNKEVKAAEASVERQALVEKARIEEERQKKLKAATEVKAKLETIKANVENSPKPISDRELMDVDGSMQQLVSEQEKAEADAINDAVNKWISQFEKL